MTQESDLDSPQDREARDATAASPCSECDSPEYVKGTPSTTCNGSSCGHEFQSHIL